MTEVTPDTIYTDLGRLERLITEAHLIRGRLDDSFRKLKADATEPASDAAWKLACWQIEEQHRTEHAADYQRSREIAMESEVILARQQAAIAAGWARQGLYV